MREADCVFCEIINGTKETSLVYENRGAIGIVDRRQANPGHVLIIPRQHATEIYSLSEEDGFAVMQGLIQVSQAVKQTFDVEGLSIWQSNGKAAGQEIGHVHFHIHPRKAGDGLLKVYPNRLERTPKEARDEYARKIKRYL